MAENPTPTTIVIFGASGDLTRRKLVPALFSLCRKNRLPANCNIVGFASSKLDTVEFRRRMRTGVVHDPQVDGQTLTFTLEEGLTLTSTETGTLWDGLTGQALEGPPGGESLSRLKSTGS